MSIEKRATKRGVVYDVRLRDPGGRHYKRTFRTKRKAMDFEASERDAHTRGAWVDPSRAKIPFRDVAVEWLESNPSKRPSTLARDESALTCHLLPQLGELPIGSVMPADIQRVVNECSRRMRPRTARRTYGVVRAVFAMAVERDYLGRTPCRGIRLPRVERVERRVVTPAELAALAEAMSPAYRPILYVGAVLGLRWGEAAALRVRSLDLLRGTLTVSATLARAKGGRVVEGPPKSELGRRTLSVPAPLLEMLAEHLARRGLTGADPEALVFAAPHGGVLRFDNWRRRVWRPACAAVGLDRLTFHDLRAACATSMVAEGIDVKTAQARLGHSDPRLTLSVYAQATTDADKEAATRLGERWMQPSEGHEVITQ